MEIILDLQNDHPPGDQGLCCGSCRKGSIKPKFVRMKAVRLDNHWVSFSRYVVRREVQPTRDRISGNVRPLNFFNTPKPKPGELRVEVQNRRSLPVSPFTATI